jgi:hypothetical protein
MKPKKPSKSTNEDNAWQEKIEKQVNAEKVQIDHPRGKERFDRVIGNSLKKKPKEDESEDPSGIQGA